MRRCRMAPAAESPARRGHGVGGAAGKAVPRKQHPCCRALRALLGRAQLQPQRSKKPQSVAEYWEAAQIHTGRAGALWQGRFCSEQGEVSLGWDPTSLPSSRSEGSFASLPGLERSPRWPCGGQVARWPQPTPCESPKALSWEASSSGTHLASPRQLQLALEPGRQ